jgi:hypothetical protein
MTPFRGGYRHQHPAGWAQTYLEKFTVSQTKIDGTIATISNQ